MDQKWTTRPINLVNAVRKYRLWPLGVLLLVVTVLMITRPIPLRYVEQAHSLLVHHEPAKSDSTAVEPARVEPAKSDPIKADLETAEVDISLQDPQFADEMWYSLCEKQKWSLYQQKQRPRRVYDLFLFNTELNWLEIRLHTLAEHVDYFVIVESSTTFTNHSKPLLLKENWDRYKQFHDQIIYRTVEAPLDMGAWDREHWQRSSMLTEVFPGLVGTPQEAVEDDVLLISDVDEIPKPLAVGALRHCNFPIRTTLASQFYYYSFQWRHQGGEWGHPQATFYRGLQDTLMPEDVRKESGKLFKEPADKAWMANSSWHCSSCFATLEQMENKMNSFSHAELNTEANRNPATIIERIRTGQDLFGRQGEKYDRIEPNPDVPYYISQDEKRFEYLLNRDGKNAGFIDVAA